MGTYTGQLTSEEREYGKISKRIYLEYLWACSVCVGTSYLVSAVGWQGLRVYTDYWLNQWTNSGNRTVDNSSMFRTQEDEVSLHVGHR
jgi:hypothetical protein